MAMKKLRSLGNGCIAAVLACTLSPTTSFAYEELAQTSSGSAAASVEASADQSAAASAAASADQASASGTSDSSGDAGTTNGDEKATIIVQLDDSASSGSSSFFGLLSTDAHDHDYYRNQIRKLAAEQNGTDASGDAAGSGDVVSGIVDGLRALVLGDGSADEVADDGTVENVQDYYHVIDGFAINAPASLLDGIKAMDGVKNAFIAQTYEVPIDQGDDRSAMGAQAAASGDSESASALKNQNSLAATGADKVSVKGTGQVIAIVDTGIDTDHEAFSGDLDDNAVALTESTIDSEKSSLIGSGGTYVSEKIPFAYDYADNDADVNPGLSGLEHGTHVAGIAAANGGDEIRGVAPDAQLLVMKVASDTHGTISDQAILAAFDDCATLKPDTVNLSIGSDAGFSDAGDATYSDAISKLQSEGIAVNVAEGNSYSAAYHNASGSNEPYATDPDYGIASTPATMDGSNAVASAGSDAVQVKDDAADATYLTAADGAKIRYSVVGGPEGAKLPNSWDSVADGSYPYVWGGIGRDSDNSDGTATNTGIADENGDVQNGEDLTGKIVIVETGSEWIYGITISMGRAASYYKGLGAKAVIFYSATSDYDPSKTYEFASDDSWYSADGVCPCIIMSKDDAMALRNAATKTVTKTTSAASDTTTESASYYPLNSWSSWGVTPDLKLKPEITAPGGNVYSSLPNGTYGYMSGTSMATPQVTGMLALMHQYTDSDSKFSGMSDDQKNVVSEQLLMSTASPLRDTSDTTTYYSPRHQGAGLANVEAATQSDVYATVEGAQNAAHPKADLGESPDGSWSFVVELHNLGSTDRSYTFDGVALSDRVSDGLFQLQSENWTGKGITITPSSNEVTVPANGTAQVTVTVSCQDAFTSWAKANTPNGTFVDGFAQFTSTDGAPSVSVPYLGFYGDWSSAPVFDQALGSSESAHAYGSRLANASSASYLLGANPLDVSNQNNTSTVDLDKMVISNSSMYGAPTAVTAQTGLLRNVDSLTYGIAQNGEDKGSLSFSYVKKTTYRDSTDSWLYAESQSPVSNGAPSIDGTGLDEGPFTLTESAVTSGPSPETQTLSYTIYYDTTAPTITHVSYADNDGNPTLTFTVEDNTYLAAIDFLDPNGSGPTSFNQFHRVVVDPDTTLTETKDDGTKVYQVTVPVSEVKADWNGPGDIPNVVSAYAWDYGKNVSNAAEAVVTPVAATSVGIDADTVDVAPGQNESLTATVLPSDTTQTNLVWRTADPSIATIDADGTLHGVAEGTTTVSVAVEDNPTLTDTAEVTVAKVGDAEGIRLSDSSLRIDKYTSDGQGGKVYNPASVSVILADSLQGKKVTWSVERADVASVEADASDSSKAQLKGEYQVGDTTVRAQVTDDAGTVHTASMTVKNRPADYDDFVIDDAGTLTGYKGVKANIQIPNNVTSIASHAFYGDAIVKSIAVPASVTTIADHAIMRIINSTSSSWSATGESKYITFEDTSEHPSQLTYIGDYAFADGGVRGDVVLPDSVTSMGAHVFDSCTGVSSVRLSDSMTEIPDGTFAGCGSLESIEISDKTERIGSSIFSGNVLFLSTIKIIGKDYTPGVIELPSALTELGYGALSAAYLGSDNVDENGNALGAVVVVPDGVKNIPDSCFSGDRFLVGVKLPDTVESIGSNAFSQASMSSFTLPASCRTLGYHAFNGMTGLSEVTLSAALGAGELEAAFGSYIGWPSGKMSVAKVNVPADSENYASVDGAVLSKDGTELVYYPAGLSGSFTVPEGVTTIDEEAFADSELSSLELPSTLTTVKESAIPAQFNTLDFGTATKQIAANAFHQRFYVDDGSNIGYTPQHLIVRGGDYGMYGDTKNAESQQTAYFGEGMTALSFAKSGAPGILVVPSTLTSLDLSGNASNPSAVTVYAPEGTVGWDVAKAALQSIGADPATQLLPYEKLGVSCRVTRSDDDGTVAIQAVAQGGVGQEQYRFVQVGTDGTETVLRDWGSEATCTWNDAAADGASLTVEVRDATMLTADKTVAAGVYTAALAPRIATDLPTIVPVQVGDTTELQVSATSPDGGTLSYRWYCDGSAIDGATGASYVPATDEAGRHQYYVVVTNTRTIDGVESSATAVSASCTVSTTVEAIADKSALTSCIEEVSGLVADGYASESWATFSSALSAAQATASDSTATQADVDQVLSALQAAYTGLAQVTTSATLADGTYDVSVSMLSALDTRGESMAGALLDSNAKLSVAGGAYTLTFNLNQGAQIMGYSAYLGNLVYYPNGYTTDDNHAAHGTGSPSAAIVVSSNADGYPTTVSIPLNDQAKSEGGTLMYGAFAQMGSQYFVISIDWAKFDETYGSHDAPVSADRSKLESELAAARSLTQGTAADVDYAVLQNAVSKAAAVDANTRATQATIDQRTVELKRAVDRFNGVAGYTFRNGGTYQMPTSWMNADGSSLSMGAFFSKVNVVKTAKGYDIYLTATASGDSRIANVRYGDDDAAATVADVSEGQQGTSAGTTYLLHADSATKALKVAYDATLDASTVTQTGYLLLDTDNVTELASPESAPQVERLAGDYAVDTAAAIASRAFEGATADTVVIARDDDYFDALSGAGLAGALDAPILLTRPGYLSDACLAEIGSLGATRAVVLGGTSAVSDDVVAALRAAGLSVERVWGDNAYGTSLAVSQKLVNELGGSARYAVAVNPTSFADAVSISGWAYRNKVPVMLQTWGDTAADRGYDDEALQILSGRTVIVCGGTAAVSDESVAGLSTVRLGGETLYDTSRAIAEWEVAQGGMSASDVSVASAVYASRGVDALAASALAGRAGGVVLLAQSNPDVDEPPLSTDVALSFLADHASEVETVHVLGGAYANSAAFYGQIEAVLGE